MCFAGFLAFGSFVGPLSAAGTAAAGSIASAAAAQILGEGF
jgi:hypothetical protein